jgi:hypothetical protein
MTAVHEQSWRFIAGYLTAKVTVFCAGVSPTINVTGTAELA